jgi:hypothetical protein
VLLIYNDLDRVFQTFGTADIDFIAAMLGEYTILIDTKTHKPSEVFNGKKQSLQRGKNTSFSALGRLSDRGGKTMVTLFENVFALVKVPYEQLPPCFDVRRAEVPSEPLSLS